MFLTDDEIRALTGKERRPAQIRQLNALGVQHRQRADRSIVVLRAHVEQLLGGQGATLTRARPEPTIQP